MSETVHEHKTPLHVWIVGVIALAYALFSVGNFVVSGVVFSAYFEEF